LKTAKVSALKVPCVPFDRAARFLEACEDKAGGSHRYGWTPDEEATPESTLCGCVAGQFMGIEPKEMKAAVKLALDEIQKAPRKEDVAALAWIISLGGWPESACARVTLWPFLRVPTVSAV
jgi:hypothetical protein